jgi:hypothetical protein
MSRWYRVFGRGERQPGAEEVVRELLALGVTAPARVSGDEEGWLAVEFVLAEESAPLILECTLASEPGVRADLNAWAAELETCDYAPNHIMLMERVIQTKQWYTVRRPLDHADEVRLDKVCEGLCRYLARATDGVYQVDGEGFFAADGECLLKEY